MAPEFVRKNLTFWGAVGGAMTALKLKQHWGDYRKVPTDEEGLGRVALRSSIDEETESLTLDTEIPMARPARKRARGCCACCGARCALFWKAFGIVLALFVTWQAIKLVSWLLTPTPTGLEGMPEYSKSLGCAEAPYIYNVDHPEWSIAVGPQGDHAVRLRSAYAVGTVFIDAAPPGVTDVQFNMVLRTNDKSLLDHVVLTVPTPEDVADGVAQSVVQLATATVPASSCMRYDVVLRVPPTVKKLSIYTGAIAQVQFSPDAQVELDELHVSMTGDSKENMLLPHANFRVKKLDLEMNHGWMVGEVAIVETTELKTQQGDAVANVKVYPVNVETGNEPEDGGVVPSATLETTTGSGRSDFFYISSMAVPHRPIYSRHLSSMNGDLYLTYKEAQFNGRVDIKAPSHTTIGVNGMSGHNNTLPWVGDADGGDYVLAQSNRGWVGLYF